MKTAWIAGLTVALLVLTRPAYTQTTNQNNFTTSSNAEYDTFHTTTVNQQMNQFSTELIAQMAGGPVLFDQTFNAAYSEPIVQAAVAVAAGVLTGAGATSITGPTETSFLQSLVNSSSVTVTNSTDVNSIYGVGFFIGPQTIPFGNFGVVQGWTLLGNSSVDPPLQEGDYVRPIGGNPQSLTLLAGQTDIDTMYFSLVDIYQTTTNTDTYLTTTVYDMVGSAVPVPEPSTAWVLGLGGVAFALYRWVTRRS